MTQAPKKNPMLISLCIVLIVAVISTCVLLNERASLETRLATLGQ